MGPGPFPITAAAFAAPSPPLPPQMLLPSFAKIEGRRAEASPSFASEVARGGGPSRLSWREPPPLQNHSRWGQNGRKKSLLFFNCYFKMKLDLLKKQKQLKVYSNCPVFLLNQEARQVQPRMQQAGQGGLHPSTAVPCPSRPRRGQRGGQRGHCQTPSCHLWGVLNKLKDSPIHTQQFPSLPPHPKVAAAKGKVGARSRNPPLRHPGQGWGPVPGAPVGARPAEPLLVPRRAGGWQRPVRS